MGTYDPVEFRNRPTVSDTLQAAEEEHYLDCPNAELRIRFAALLLDLILAALSISGLENVCSAIQAHLNHLDISTSNESSALWKTILLTLHFNASSIAGYLFIFLRLTFLYFYFIWSLMFSGGTPGKLILGLRVVNSRTGGFPTLSFVFLRESSKALGILIGGISIFYFFLSKDKKILHELLSETSVKRIHGRL